MELLKFIQQKISSQIPSVLKQKFTKKLIVLGLVPTSYLIFFNRYRRNIRNSKEGFY